MTWTALTARGNVAPPNVRGGHTANSFDGKLFVFGGGSGTQYANDLHVFDFGTCSCNLL